MTAKLIAGALAVGSLTSQNEPLITVDTWFTPAPQHSYGRAVWYGPNVMEATAYWRQLSLEGFLDGIALMSPADIGKTVWLKRIGIDTEWQGPFLVVDCAARGDMPRAVSYVREVAELGFVTAVRWGMVNPGYRDAKDVHKVYQWSVDIEVWVGDTPPTIISNSEPINYPEWWESIAEYTNRFDPHPYYLFGYGWNMRDGRIKQFEDFVNPSFEHLQAATINAGQFTKPY